MVKFTTKNGETLIGEVIYSYSAFEVIYGLRYVIRTKDGREYRCVKDADDNYVEFVA